MESRRKVITQAAMQPWEVLCSCRCEWDKSSFHRFETYLTLSHCTLMQVFCSLSGFMLGYHVHEKAIMTAIIPLTLLATESPQNARLYIRICTFGLFGLLPLLFRPEELLCKVLLYVAWMSGTIYALEQIHGALLTRVDQLTFATLACVLLFMEIIHPIFFMPSGRLEFLPLMATSVICAVGLTWCWVESYNQMIFGSVKTAQR